MEQDIFISIIICTRNRKEFLLRICHSIKHQSYGNYEIVVVDSSDTEKTTRSDLQTICGIENEIRIIYSDPGLTKQRNIGIENAKGEIFIFFDDDMILEPSFLLEMVKVFKENNKYYGGMGAFSNVGDPTTKDKLFNGLLRFFFLRNSYGNGKYQKSGFPSFPVGKKTFMDTEVLVGSMQAYKREIFEKFKYDEFFSNYSYMEDIEFSRRVSMEYPLFYNPKAIAEHRHASGGRGNYFENRRMYVFNHRYIFEKNFPQRFSYKLAHMWSIVGLYFFAIWDYKTAKISFPAYAKGLKDYKIYKKARA